MRGEWKEESSEREEGLEGGIEKEGREGGRRRGMEKASE